jgi:hypothetical protein
VVHDLCDEAVYIDAVNQSLIQSTLIFRKPFKGFRRKYISNKGKESTTS